MGRLFLISGDDDQARKERARELMSELSGTDEPENASTVEIVSGDSQPSVPAEIVGRFLNSLLTPPFLADRKILWLRHYPDLSHFSDAEENSVFFAAAERLKKPLPPELEVVIDGPNLDQRKSWVKQLKAANAVIENRAVCKATDRNYVENRRQEILSWSRNTGKKLEPEALQYLIEVIASAGGTLRSELEKLDCYTGKKPLITLSDCRNIISRTPEAISWQFTSAIVQGNRNAALQLLNALMSQGDNEIGILAQLSSEFQKMMQTHLAMAELQITRLSPRTFDQIPDAVRAAHPDNPLLKLHPYRAFKICESAGALTPAGLGKKLNALRDAARQLVSGGGNRQIIMELLVLKLTEKTP